jgi:prophage antirepressor-like protein
MTAIQPFAFEEHVVRVIERDEAPWFVGRDVCRALGIGNESQALGRLDDDEKGVCNVYPLSDDYARGGGAQDAIVINEPGVYQLIFTSRKPEAKRFKRWLAHEVLPALRKHGAYAMPETSDAAADLAEPPEHPASRKVLLVEEMNAKARLLCEARHIYGREAAAKLWTKFHLPRIEDRAPASLADSPEDLPESALKHLLNFTAGSALRVRDILRSAMLDRIAAKRAEGLGLRVGPQTFPNDLVVADSHDFLDKVFAETQWRANWNMALARLPGARRCRKRVMIDGRHARGVAIPLNLIT